MNRNYLYFGLALVFLAGATMITSYIHGNEDDIDLQIQALRQDIEAHEKALQDINLKKLEANANRAIERLQRTE